MGLQAGMNLGLYTPNSRHREIDSHNSAMATEEQGRKNTQLGMLEKLQGIRETESKYGDYLKDSGLRDEARAQGIMEARAGKLRAQQDADARNEVDSVSRLEMAYKTNNPSMWDSTLGDMHPSTRQALDGIPAEQIPSVLSDMRRIATRNLDQLRANDQINEKASGQMGVARVTGQEARATGHQSDMNAQVRQQEADANANYRTRVSSGAPGMIADQALDDPAAAKAKQDAYIYSEIGALNRKGMPKSMTVPELNAAYDRSVSSGMEATASSIISEYEGLGVEIPDIDDAAELSDYPGWAGMRTQANKWAKLGASGSDIHDGLMGRYILINKQKGFIPMPRNARGEPVGTKTALELMQEARATGEDIKDVVRRYGRRIEHTTGIIWDHGL